jgi:hypothetical protein
MRTLSGKGGKQYEDTSYFFSDPGGGFGDQPIAVGADGTRNFASSRRRGSRQSRIQQQ